MSDRAILLHAIWRALLAIFLVTASAAVVLTTRNAVGAVLSCIIALPTVPTLAWLWCRALRSPRREFFARASVVVNMAMAWFTGVLAIVAITAPITPPMVVVYLTLCAWHAWMSYRRVRELKTGRYQSRFSTREKLPSPLAVFRGGAA